MLRIEVGEKKESIFYAITLGCVLLIVIGVTRFYWTRQSSEEIWNREEAKSCMTKGDMAASGTDDKKVTSPKVRSPRISMIEETNQSSSLAFFCTLIFALLLIFCMTFRYYSRREMKEAERRWKTTCANFLTRMESERFESQEEMRGRAALWSQILQGDGVKTTK